MCRWQVWWVVQKLFPPSSSSRASSPTRKPVARKTGLVGGLVSYEPEPVPVNIVWLISRASEDENTNKSNYVKATRVNSYDVSVALCIDRTDSIRM